MDSSVSKSPELVPGVATRSEIMAARAAQELRDSDVVFVGIGLPNLACNLARATHAPNLCMIYESGAVGAIPDRLPVSIGDPALVTDSLSIVGMADIFQNYLQRGFIEVGFLGGAQVDRFGNINTTVIGDYANPKVRLPGSGGACEIAVHSRRLLIVMRMSPKSFVEKCDFITSPGHFMHGKSRSALKLPGSGPLTAITDLGVCQFVDGEMQLTEIYPGVSLEQIQAACGWTLKIAANLQTAKAPSAEVVQLLRTKLDPQRMYL
jgi:glutaconate CoA-transferase subunit B